MADLTRIRGSKLAVALLGIGLLAAAPAAATNIFTIGVDGGGGVGGSSQSGTTCTGDVVKITAAKYSDSKARLKVFAEHPSDTASLTVSVEGFVVDGAMTYKPAKDRYLYFEEIEVDLDGLEVTVSDEDGNCGASPIH